MPTDSLTIDEAATWITRSDQEWTSTTVTYSFPMSMPSDYSGDGFEAFDAARQASVELALALWSDVCGLTFVEADPGEDGDIRFFAFSMVDEEGVPLPGVAYGSYPGPGASIRFNTNASSFDNMSLGQGGFETLLHEIGHTLGLSHPGNYDAGQGATYEGNAEYIEDSEQYTLMTYFGEENTGADFDGNRQLAPMLHDIAAVEQMYGDNPNTRTGNTTYGFNSNSDRIIHRFDDSIDIDGVDTQVCDIPVFCIYDSGGVDTIDLSGYGADEAQRLDLNQMAFSYIAGMTANVSIARYTEIENAVGGAGDDDIEGNELNNNIAGNDGDDTIDGNDGSDFLTGGDGEDWLYGGEDADYIFGGTQGDQIAGGSGDDHIFGEAGVDFITGDEGADEIFGGSEGDYIYGGEQDETPYGASLAEELSNGAGNGDFLYGEDGNDSLYGGFGADLLTGWLGDDYLQGGWGQDSYYGGAGTDTVSFTYASLGWLLHLDNDGQGNGDARLIDAPVFVEVLSSIENADMGSGDDEVWGSAAANIVWGNAGDDLILGLGGNDELRGRGGDDVMTGGNGADTFLIQPGTGTDTVADLVNGVDMVRLLSFAGIDDFDDLMFAGADSGADSSFELGGGDSLVIVGHNVADLQAADFLFA
jgi:serralysin